MMMTDYLRFLAALLAVLGLIGLFAWIAKRFRLGGLAGASACSRRLCVVETLPIDGRQRLLLIRRDDREHLLLMGQERSLVIESGIAAASDLEATSKAVPEAAMSAGAAF